MTADRFIALDRRRFLKSATALVALGLLPAEVLALAGPSKLTVGSVELTIVSDGALILPVAMLAPDADPAALNALLTDAGVKDGTLSFAANTVVAKDGADTVLVDMGSGDSFQPTAGKLFENLAAAGIDPAAITKVAFTHGHIDHLFGATKGGALQLPNAGYDVAQAEWDFWNDKDIFAKLPEGMHGMAKGAQANYAAMKDKTRMFKPGDAISANITAIDTSGHTPGHVSFEVAGGDGLIIAGDVIPNSKVHFVHPEWRMAFDGDPAKAIASRKMLLERVSTEKKLILGYHWQTPVGYAEKKDAGYLLNPLT